MSLASVYKMPLARVLKPPFTLHGGAGDKSNYRPDYKPGPVDYASPSLYQSSPAYNPKTSPGPTQPGPYNQSPTPVHPSTSLFANNSAPSPITPNSTGQFGLAAGASPFSAAQNTQASTITGSASVKSPVLSVLKPKPKPKKKKPSSLDKYLTGDSDYQNTLRDLNRALADFKARQNVEKTRAGTENSYARHTMALQKTQDLKDIMDDAAARGIVTSGVYGQRVGDYNTTYNNQLGELGRQYNSQLEDFASALADFTRQQALQKEAARTAAIRRRSAKLGKVG